MKPRSLILSIMCLISIFVGWACGAGVEVGNPKVVGKVITIDPAGRPETYVIRFQEDGSTEVSKILEDQFETVAASAETDGESVVVSATFPAGPVLQAHLQVDESGNITVVSLILDGVPVGTEFSTDTEKPSLKALWSNDALLTVATICRRVVECQATTIQTECESDLAATPGLAQSLGGAPGHSLQETAEALDNGNIQSDPEALSACLQEIEILPCQQVDKAHDPEDPHSYQQAQKLIPKPTCVHAFVGQP